MPQPHTHTLIIIYSTLAQQRRRFYAFSHSILFHTPGHCILLPCESNCGRISNAFHCVSNSKISILIFYTLHKCQCTVRPQRMQCPICIWRSPILLASLAFLCANRFSRIYSSTKRKIFNSHINSTLVKPTQHNEH